MKIALISDLHFGKRELDFTEMQLQYFEKVAFPYLLENNIQNVLQLGDTFDSRKFSNNTMLSMIGERYFSWFNKNKITLYSIVGNHDTPNKDHSKYSPLYQYKSKYIIPIKKNKIIDLGGVSIAMHSFFCNDEKDFYPADIGLFHHEFIGQKMNKLQICENGNNLPTEKYKKIYSGHFHSSQSPYLKVPYQMSFESFGDVNGITIIDLETLSEEFIENKFSQRFLKVYYYNKNKIAVEDGIIKEEYNNTDDALIKIGNNIIELNIENIDDKNIVDDFIDKIKNKDYIYNNYFIDNKIVVDKDKELSINKNLTDVQEMISEYIKTIDKEIPEMIDKKLLKEEFVEIYNDVMTEDKL